MKTLAVLGAGLMGAGIAEVSARAGSGVILVDASANAGAKGRAPHRGERPEIGGERQLDRVAATEVLDRITISTDIGALAAADFVIEAVFENLAVKKDASRSWTRSSVPIPFWPATLRRCPLPRSVR